MTGRLARDWDPGDESETSGAWPRQDVHLDIPDGIELWAPGDQSGAEPTLPDTVYHGPLGDAIALIDPYTEATPAAVGIGVIIRYGVILGRDVWRRIGRQHHYPNLFAVIVGPSSTARKGVADDEAEALIDSVAGGELRTESGFGSGEKLVDAIADPVYDDEMLIGGHADQRMLVNENEFQSVLARINRENGNTLSAIYRNLFDGKPTEVRTRGHGDVVATNPHVGIIGAITPDELRRELSQMSISNGFANRHMFIYSNSNAILPHGADIPPGRLNPIIEQANHGFRMRGGEITFGPDAYDVWADDIYPRLRVPNPDPLLDNLLARGPTHVTRLAMIYATADNTTEITLPHLRAAESWWNYSTDTARFVFAGAVTDPVAQRVLQGLRRSPGRGLTRSELHDLFSRNLPAIEIDMAIELLAREGLAHQFKGQGAPGGGPKPTLVVATRRTQAVS
jgi:hypothetical protein